MTRFDIHPPPSSAPVACILSGIPEQERPRWIALGKAVYDAVVEVIELDDGYACRLGSDASTLRDVAEHVSLDRRCCPFLRWTIRVEPEYGPVWLSMTGTHAAKAMLREAFETTDLLPIEVAREAGFETSRRARVDLPSVDGVAHRLNEAANRGLEGPDPRS